MSERRDPLKRARGLGSARTGVTHFMQQRITAIALIVLSIWFVAMVLGMLHADYASARAIVAQPLNSLVLIAFAIAVFWHTQLGLQVVIEDYVHSRGLEVAMQIAVKLLCFLGALASVLAVIRIGLGS